ncbi:hypothetical protein KCP77_21005 [Salmonella enterica subsp. enterica]|nr:hypothetical protein KCP77_21005 [Salmonella enterica subsp. enterica]
MKALIRPGAGIPRRSRSTESVSTRGRWQWRSEAPQEFTLVRAVGMNAG